MHKRWILLLFLLLAVSTSARAQGNKGFVIGQLGFTFAESTSGLYGAEVGVNVSPNVLIIGTFNYMGDVLTGKQADFLRTVSLAAGARIDGKLPASYGAAGVRFQFGSVPGVNPYVQIEGGVAKLAPDLTIISDGRDITDQVQAATDLDSTKAAVAIGAGIRLDFSEWLTATVAAKWMNIATEETLKVNRVHFGIGLRF